MTCDNNFQNFTDVSCWEIVFDGEGIEKHSTAEYELRIVTASHLHSVSSLTEKHIFPPLKLLGNNLNDWSSLILLLATISHFRKMVIFKEDTTHVVVMFDGERRKCKKVIDLVPRSWLTCFEEDIIFCSYPPDKDCDHVDEWTKAMVEPDPAWKKHRVTVEIRRHSNQINTHSDTSRGTLETHTHRYLPYSLTLHARKKGRHTTLAKKKCKTLTIYIIS